MDVLAPGIGEIIGGSQREERLDVLDRRHRRDGPRQGRLLVVPRPAPLRHRAARRASAWASSARSCYVTGHGEHPRRDPVPAGAQERGVLAATITKRATRTAAGLDGHRVRHLRGSARRVAGECRQGRRPPHHPQGQLRQLRLRIRPVGPRRAGLCVGPGHRPGLRRTNSHVALPRRKRRLRALRPEHRAAAAEHHPCAQAEPACVSASAGSRSTPTRRPTGSATGAAQAPGLSGWWR